MIRSRFFRRTLHALGLLALSASLIAVSALYYLGHTRSDAHPFAAVMPTRELLEAAFHPQELFPGKSRLNILCLGLDRDWDDRDLPSSRQSRTDTMLVASLDLASHQVSALSIPRDSRVEIPRHGFHKINDAYPLGGIDGTVRTVNRFLDVPVDEYVVVKLGAVQRFVDAIGGITLDVEKDMDYDDNWGQLHVHLKQGLQHLNGAQVEGYMRFRHDRESDFGRMRRQQQTIRAILGAMQTPSIAFRIPKLVDAFRQSIETNLTRDQILALARMFHQVRPDTVVSDIVPGRNEMLDGVAYVEPDPERRKLLVDWLLKGDQTAAHRLTTVRVLNGCRSRRTARQVAEQLEAQQFEVIYAGKAPEATPVTHIEGHGRHPEAGQQVQALLSGGKLDWSPGTEAPVVTVTVGQDQVARAAASSTQENPPGSGKGTDP